MPKAIKCFKCGHASIVRSNFKGLPDGRFYCNSVKRLDCEIERQNELRYEKGMRENTIKFSNMFEYKT